MCKSKRITLLGWFSAFCCFFGCGHGHESNPSPGDPAPPVEECRYLIGPDMLAINSAHWDCPAMLKAMSILKCKIPFGVFFDTHTFGPNRACLEQALKTGKIYALRGHLEWSNHALRSVQQLAPAAQAFNGMCQAHPEIECYPSSICELQSTAQQSAALHAGLRPFLTAPNMKEWVDSGSSPDPAAIREKHGNKSAAPIVSQDGGDNNDGNGFFDVDFLKVSKLGTQFFFPWDELDNCKFSSKDKRPANQRTDCPTEEQFFHQFRLSMPLAAIPAGEGPTGGRIYKPSSDNHGGCRGKDCKAALLVPLFSGRPLGEIPFYSKKGKKLGAFVCYQEAGKPCGDKRLLFEGRLIRYYAPMGAYPIGAAAEADADTELITVDEGRAKYTLNPYIRGGVFR